MCTHGVKLKFYLPPYVEKKISGAQVGAKCGPDHLNVLDLLGVVGGGGGGGVSGVSWSGVSHKVGSHSSLEFM